MALTRRAVRQAGVHHRRRFVHAPADLRHDAVDDLQQVVVVAELDVGLFHLAAALDVDLVRPVDQDVADRRVLEQHLQRAEAERLVEHLVDEALALHAVEQRVFGVAQALDDQANFAAQRVAFQVADARQVELVDQLAVDEPFEFLEALVALAVAAAGHASRCRCRLVPCRVLLKPLRPRCKRDMGASSQSVQSSVSAVCRRRTAAAPRRASCDDELVSSAERKEPSAASFPWRGAAAALPHRASARPAMLCCTLLSGACCISGTPGVARRRSSPWRRWAPARRSACRSSPRPSSG